MGIVKRLDLFFAQAFDIKGITGNKMAQTLHCLGLAGQTATTTPINLAFVPHRRSAADRASRGKDESFGTRLNHFQNLRDHVAGALHQNLCPNPDVLFRDVVLVMQGRVGNHHATDGNGFQARHRGQLAGPANLNIDSFDQGLGLLGGKLVGNRPARRARGRAQTVLPV